MGPKLTKLKKPVQDTEEIDEYVILFHIFLKQKGNIGEV